MPNSILLVSTITGSLVINTKSYVHVFQFKSVTKFLCRHVSQTLKCADTEHEKISTGQVCKGRLYTLDPRNRHSRTRGPGTRAPRVLRAMTTIQAISANAMSLTDIQLCLVRGCHAHQRCYL